MNGKSEQILEEEREEIIRYGMKRGKVIIVSTLITILIGYFLGIPRQSIIFWFSLSILRRYAGGYHADSEEKCYITSFAMVIISLFCIEMLNYKKEIGIILQTISLIIILFLAPMENKNNTLDDIEKKKYGIRTRIIGIGEYAISCLLYEMGYISEGFSIGVANFVVGLMLIVGYMKMVKEKNMKKHC